VLLFWIGFFAPAGSVRFARTADAPFLGWLFS
jgi:hypothetical protein